MSKYTTEHPTQEIPSGYCHCGCGNLTPIATHTCTKAGIVRGQPCEFCRGHTRKMRPSVAERFWSHVAMGRSNECWLWLARKRNGYGQFSVSHRVFPRIDAGAHRFAWELTYGPIPEGLYCCHRCDQSACVNPAHLFLGTQKDNLNDCIAKGRFVNPPAKRGSEQGQAKLTEQEIFEIRSQYQGGMTQVELATIYHVTQGNISSIVLHKTWRHV